MVKIKGSDTLGERLRKQREALELSLEDVSREIQAPRKFVEALETDNLEMFPAKVYALGFLKKLLEVLKFEETDRFLKEFGNEWEVRTFRRHRELAPLPENRGIVPWVTPVRLGIAVGGLALLFLLAFLGFRLTRFLGAPSLLLQEPQDQAVYSRPVVPVKGRTEKESRLTVNGREINIDEAGNFKEDIELGAGAHILEFIVENRFGRISKEVRNIVIR